MGPEWAEGWHLSNASETPNKDDSGVYGVYSLPGPSRPYTQHQDRWSCGTPLLQAPGACRGEHGARSHFGRALSRARLGVLALIPLVPPQGGDACLLWSLPFRGPADALFPPKLQGHCQLGVVVPTGLQDLCRNLPRFSSRARAQSTEKHLCWQTNKLGG